MFVSVVLYYSSLVKINWEQLFEQYVIITNVGFCLYFRIGEILYRNRKDKTVKSFRSAPLQNSNIYSLGT
jgi:hypothetical protein